ncbi:amidohydrolase family protein [Bradyrhizobium roseum]|uniref:amidohydrolase family protein n=1 Tax=Bradyrhizobium roseum TaxID=3056648 RepID=UPI00387E4896
MPALLGRGFFLRDRHFCLLVPATIFRPRPSLERRNLTPSAGLSTCPKRILPRARAATGRIRRCEINKKRYQERKPWTGGFRIAGESRSGADVSGGDWPHPRVEGEMPDAGHLLELFQAWTPDKATQQRILVDNPAKLHGFPN